MSGVEIGERHTIVIDGRATVVGFNKIRGEWQAAYLPKTNYRFSPGEDVVTPTHRFQVVRSQQSDRMPRMVLLTLKERR